MEIQIQNAEKKDAKYIVSILDQSWRETYINDEAGVTKDRVMVLFSNTKQRINNWTDKIDELDWKENGVWLGKLDGEIAGFVAPSIDKKGRRRVGALYILQKFHGMGLGKSLLQKVFDLYPNDDIYIDVVRYNERAKLFYAAQGFVPTGGQSNMDIKRDEKVLVSLPVEEWVRKGK